MSLSEQITLAWLALGRTLGAWLRPALWAPWLLLAAVQAGVVVCLWWFAHPWVSWFMAPLLVRIGGEGLLQFPNALVLLPRLFGRVDLVVGALFGSLAIGFATRLFADRFAGRPVEVGAAIGVVLRRAPAIVLALLPMNLLLVLFGLALEWMAQRPAGLVVQVAMLAAGWTVPILIQAFFLFAIPLVIVGGHGAVGAMRALPDVWRRGFWAALLLGAVGLAILIPFQLLASGSQTIVARGNPDLVAWITLVQVGAGVVVGFLLSGGSTLYYMSALTERDR